MQDAYYQRHEVSNSDLSWCQKYWNSQEVNYDIERAYRFGRLVDILITEAHKANLYTGIIGGEKYTPGEVELAQAMKKSFLRDPLCKSISQQATGQQVFSDPGLEINYGHIRFTLPFRCKYDLWMPGAAWGADIKSTTATTDKQFRAAIEHFDYDRQRYAYMTLSGSKRDLLIGISKENYKVFKVPIIWGDDIFLSGKEKFEDLAFRYWELFGEVSVLEKEILSV